MRTTRPIASTSFALATLMLSLAASAQTAPPQAVPAGAAPAPQGQPAPAAAAPGAPGAPPAYPATAAAHPPAAAPSPVYRPLQPAPQLVAPMQPYPAYDPSTGQMVMVSPLAPAQRMPPKELPYVESRPIPPGYAIDEYHPRGLIIGGAITLGALWAISFSVASSNDYSGANGWLAVPVIGPFGWLATRKAPRCEEMGYSYSCNSDESSNRTLVAFDGIGQVAGAAMLIAGLAITRKHLVLVDPQAAFSVAPYASSRGSGLQLIGRF